MVFDFAQWMLIAAAVLGTLFAAALGWLESGELFVWRKFTGSLLRAVIAGVLVAFGFQNITTPDAWNLAFAFLTGAGVDVLGNRIAGALATKAKEELKE
jgi:membrane-bound metal-dependent hydrolase YbcI (DUF457 family)